MSSEVLKSSINLIGTKEEDIPDKSSREEELRREREERLHLQVARCASDLREIRMRLSTVEKLARYGPINEKTNSLKGVGLALWIVGTIAATLATIIVYDCFPHYVGTYSMLGTLSTIGVVGIVKFAMDDLVIASGA